jgi:hypothetical protein
MRQPRKVYYWIQSYNANYWFEYKNYISSVRTCYTKCSAFAVADHLLNLGIKEVQVTRFYYKNGQRMETTWIITDP